MSKKNGNGKENGSTKVTKKLFPKTIWVENYGTKKKPDIFASHDLDTIGLDYSSGVASPKPTTLARYELVEVGTLETTTKFKVAE